MTTIRRRHHIIVDSVNRWVQRAWSSSSRKTLRIIAIFVTTLLIYQSFRVPTSVDGDDCNEMDRMLESIVPARIMTTMDRRRHQLAFDQHHKEDGVILFWHVPKTGGTTVRTHLANITKLPYRAVFKRGDWERTLPQIETHLSSPSERGWWFIELHGQGTPPGGIEELLHRVIQWRRLAENHETGLFVFTVFREPVEHSVSYYTQAFKSNRHSGETSHFLSSVKNRQCQSFAESNNVVGPSECSRIYENLLSAMDWIGTTEMLSNTTLPLLHRTVVGHHQLADSDVSTWNRNVAKNKIWETEQLSSEMAQRIHEHTCLDRALWKRVVDDYKLSRLPFNLTE